MHSENALLGTHDGFSGEFGTKGVKDQNNVVVTIFAWKCVENCKQEKKSLKVRADGIIPPAQIESAVIAAALGKAGVAE